MKIWLSIILILLSPVSLADQISIEVKGSIENNTLQKQIDILNKAKSNDSVIVYVDSLGGLVWEMTKACKAMINSPAKHITAVINQEAASAAADLSVCADRVILKRTATLTYHLGCADSKCRKVYTIDADLSKVSAFQKIYILNRIKFEKTILTKLGLPSSDVYKSLHGYDGLEFNGSYFGIYNPNGDGLRRDKDFHRALDNLTNADTTD